MDVSHTLSRLGIERKRELLAFLAGPPLAYAAARLFVSLYYGRRLGQDYIYRSPRRSLQLLDSKQRPDQLPYPQDALPGARDVDTPYGNIRVYEWGPEDGRKVLFVHGISTPCIAFAGMAKKLVEEHGCRVMLFDLFGRGYSDCPDTTIYHQDLQLWTSQILLVLTSSKLAWTGSERFTLVGYSMGGGIAAAFTSIFPELVGSLILVATAGLLRPDRIHWTSKLIYGGFMPNFVVDWLVSRRLRGGAPPIPQKGKETWKNKQAGPAKIAESEVPAPHPALTPNSSASLFPDRPGMSIAKAVAWQLDSHPGFLPAFISSIQHAPISNQHERWKLIASRLNAQRSSPDAATQAMGLKEGKVLILLGKQDSVIISKEVEEDATAVLGKDNVDIVNLEGGHDVPVVNSTGCVEAMVKFFNSGKV